MNFELHYGHRNPSEPFRWKLFIVVVLIMGSLTAGAIALARMASPARSVIAAPLSSDPSM